MPETLGPGLSCGRTPRRAGGSSPSREGGGRAAEAKAPGGTRPIQEAAGNFQLTETHVQTVIERIRRAFDRGETELMLTSFPSSFCTDGGRAINNADAPPINKPDKEEHAQRSREPEWLATLPAGARPIYEYWKTQLQPGGFRFTARIINYPGGVPGDVGLFFSWPKSATDTPS